MTGRLAAQGTTADGASDVGRFPADWPPTRAPVMPVSRNEALTTSKRLRRSSSSAPDPRVQARAIYTALAAADGWKPQEQQTIDALGAWLAERPSPEALRDRCEQVLRMLTSKLERRGR